MSTTLLIGLDGATFSILDPLVRQGVMPVLGELAAGGVRADLLSTPHPLTPPAWTTLMTGRTPGNHGIFDFVRVTQTDDRPQFAIATSRDVRAETLWSVASRQGRRVVSLNFPLMFPPRPVEGYVIPGFLPWRHLRRYVHPPELYGTLLGLPGFDPAELLLNMDLERESLQVLPREQYADWIRLHIRRERQWAEIACHLLATDPCDLVAVLFDGVDKLQHLCWRFLDPALAPAAPSAWEREVTDLCLEYFHRLDDHIGRLLALAGEECRVVVASDHGFGPTREIFYVNAWLHREGYLEWAPGVVPDELGRQMVEGHRNPVVLFDWERTTACALTAGSNGIWIRVAADGHGPGVAPEEYPAFRAELTRKLLALIDPRDGQPIVTGVLAREDAFAGTQTDRAPDLTLVLRDRGFVSVLHSDSILRPRPEIMGTHHPDGILLASGPGVREGAEVAPLRIQDVAPLLLYSLGLPIPEDLDGRFPAELFAPGQLAVRPAETGPATLPPDPFLDGRPVAVDRATEEQVIGRLQALGYLE